MILGEYPPPADTPAASAGGDNEEILYDYKAATPAGRKPFCTGWNTISDRYH